MASVFVEKKLVGEAISPRIKEEKGIFDGFLSSAEEAELPVVHATFLKMAADKQDIINQLQEIEMCVSLCNEDRILLTGKDIKILKLVGE